MPRGGSGTEVRPRSAPSSATRSRETTTGASVALARTRFVRKSSSWRIPGIDRTAPGPIHSEGGKAGTLCPTSRRRSLASSSGSSATMPGDAEETWSAPQSSTIEKSAPRTSGHRTLAPAGRRTLRVGAPRPSASCVAKATGTSAAKAPAFATVSSVVKNVPPAPGLRAEEGRTRRVAGGAERDDRLERPGDRLDVDGSSGRPGTARRGRTGRSPPSPRPCRARASRC